MQQTWVVRAFLFVLLFVGSLMVGFSQPARDSLALPDTVVTTKLPFSAYANWVEQLYQVHPKLASARLEPQVLTAQPNRMPGQEPLFYWLLSWTGLLAFLRFFYPRYFDNLFRVFFNTSLRQSQLTDQLLQSKLPSLLFNFFSAVVVGTMFAQVALQYGLFEKNVFWTWLLLGVVGTMALYSGKALWLQLVGWMTGVDRAASNYTFVVFLVYKILGILLFPCAWVLAFSEPPLPAVAAAFSLMLVGFLLLTRFIRSYGLLGNSMQVSRWHFLLYVIGLELLPLALLVKGLMLLFTKNR